MGRVIKPTVHLEKVVSLLLSAPWVSLRTFEFNIILLTFSVDT